MKVPSLFRFLIILALVLTNLSCSSLQPLSADDRASYHRLAVVSVLGEKISGVFVGPTIFQNRYFEAVLGEESLAPAFENDARKVLGTAFPTEAVSSERQKIVTTFNPMLLSKTYNIDGFLDELRTRGVDGLIVIDHWIYGEEDFIGRTPEKLRGLGLYGRQTLSQESGKFSCYVYASIMVSLFDTRTKKIVFSEISNVADPIDISVWPESFGALSDVVRRNVLQELAVRVGQEISKALRYRFFSVPKA